MEQEWKVLCAAGVPDGPVRVQSSAVDLAEVRSALCVLAGAPEAIEVARREPLLSWLKAFRHEYPSRFAAELGSEGDRMIARLDTAAIDANRYLKLRRIAAENLGRWL